MEKIHINRVIFSDPATIVLWSDGTKTIAKCQKDDVFNKETGLAIALLKKTMGRKNFHRIFNKYITEE